MQPVVQRSRERATTKQGLSDKVQGEDSVKHRDMTNVSVLEVKVSTTSVYSQLPSLKIVVNVAKERGERGVLKI